jgi:plastocyanin
MKTRNAASGLFLTAMMLLLVNCGGGGGSGGGTPPASTVEVVNCATVMNPVDITAAGSAFAPINQTIAVNDVVRWTNGDPMLHTVTSSAVPAGGAFDRNLAANGGTLCLRFTAAGVYNYICTIHAGMNGTITVQ